MIDDATLAVWEDRGGWLYMAVKEIRRLREECLGLQGAYTMCVEENGKRGEVLTAHRAVVRAAEDVVIEWRAGRTPDHLYQLSEALAHLLVQQAREDPHV
mgnify:CR=1 FL=1